MNQKHQHPAGATGHSNPAANTTAEVAPDAPLVERSEQEQRYLRLAADFDNFRKRTKQETEQRAGAQKEALLRELLPVVDNLERALTVTASTPFAQLFQGVEMTLQQLRQILHQNDVDVEESEGKPFDPLRHEAIGSRHDPSQRDQAVLETAQRGYRRGQGVFRPAKVIVNDCSQPG
ncbi:MAG: heat shock protein GrpE [Pedosphaera sp.]|nr:heat shock protein GrpE [Pedosphaera sp.]